MSGRALSYDFTGNFSHSRQVVVGIGIGARMSAYAFLRGKTVSIKRAAIYVRVSSERQAGQDRVSIESQLSDCEAYCQSKGYFIVERYIDKDKYRVKGKLVQPSGQRKDRPGYKALLNAARQNEFDVIVAWKEDRLYRGMYAAMPLSEILDEKGSSITVELVRETFDRKMLGIKAALGKIEVDNIRERMIMGRRARLERGEVPGGNQVKYGYQRVNKRLEIEETEAAIVLKIFDWYIAGENSMQIRRRLNDMGIAPRRGKLWSKTTIGKILSSDCYALGKIKATLDGEIFYTPCPPILPMDVWNKAKKVRQGNKKQAKNIKRDYLCVGLVYCACGWKCHVKTTMSNRSRGYTSLSGAYVCQRYFTIPESRPKVCATNTGSLKVDNYVWGFVKHVCSNPEIIKKAIYAKLDRLKAEQERLETEFEAIQGKLDEVLLERQWVITQARKGRINEDDMELQLGQLHIQEWSLKKEAEEYQALVATKEQANKLAVWADQYLSDIHAGIAALEVNVDELSKADFEALFSDLDANRFAGKFPEDRIAQMNWAILEEKRRIVRMLIKKVIVGHNENGKGRKIEPILAFDIPLDTTDFLNSSDQSIDYIQSEQWQRKISPDR